VLFTAAGPTSARPVERFCDRKSHDKTEADRFTVVTEGINRLSTNLKTENFSTGILHFDAVARQFKATKMVRVFPNAGRIGQAA
jgi:hypothetical protein